MSSLESLYIQICDPAREPHVSHLMATDDWNCSNDEGASCVCVDWFRSCWSREMGVDVIQGDREGRSSSPVPTARDEAAINLAAAGIRSSRSDGTKEVYRSLRNHIY